MSGMKKTLAYLYHGKPMEWVEYQTLAYSVDEKGNEFELTENVQLMNGAWAAGRSRTYSSIDEIDKLMVPKFVKSEEGAGYDTARKKIWYRLPHYEEE